MAETAVEESAENEDVNELDGSIEYKSDKREYKSESSKEKYEESDYKKAGTKNASKKSGKKSELEKKVSDIAEEAEKSGHSNNSYSSNDDTLNGSVAFVYYIDEETGRCWAYIEQKPRGYPISTEQGNISFIGGAKKTGESGLEALARELWEEVDNPAAKSALIKTLEETQEKYDTLSETIDGHAAHVDVWKIRLKSRKDWELVKSSGLTEGIARVLPFETILELDDNYFAFGYGPVFKEIAKNIINEESGIKSNHALNKNHYSDSASLSLLQPYLNKISDNKFIPAVYKDSFIPNAYKSPSLIK